MKSKSYFFTALCCLLLGTGMQVLEAKEKEISINREEDLKVILNQTFLREDKFDKTAAMYLAQRINQMDHRIPVESIVSRMRQGMQSKEMMKQLMAPYSAFSDEEIHELREMFESEAFTKYTEQSFFIMQSNMRVMDQMLNTVLHQGFEVIEMPTKKRIPTFEADSQEIDDQEVKYYQSSKQSDSEILQITKDNYSEEVEESDKPVILDVYADWCRPCHAFAQTFEEIQEEYKDQCRFGRVNSDQENMLVTFLKVKKYPTTVFIYKGKVISREIGNMPKDKFEEKIKNFLKEIQDKE
jgi:thioredoxin 1